MHRPPYGGVYANMDFDKIYGPKSYQEYPKHIPVGSNGEYLVAHTPKEEEEILGTLQEMDDNAPAKVEHYVADPEKEILISRAREIGVAFNRKWSKAKLKQVVEEAEAEIDALPVERAAEEEDTGETPEEMKDRLIQEAKSLGIPANKLWGIPRLKSTIAEHKNK